MVENAGSNPVAPTQVSDQIKSHKNLGDFLTYTSLKILAIALAMPAFFVSSKSKISSQFIGNTILITYLYRS